MTQALVTREDPTAGGDKGTSSRGWGVAGGVIVLVFLIWRMGTGPFVEGVRATTGWAIATALLVTAATTWCCTQRWRRVAAWSGESIPLRTAYAAYYRSQFINATVPGGIAGDLHRGWRLGWGPVVWERGIGQAVQVVLAGTLLAPGGWRWAGAAFLVCAALTGGSVVVLSALSSLGHLGVFLVAATAVGADLPLATLLPVGALVLLGSAIPFNLAGWGPREGVAAWAFASYGSTQALGLTVSVSFGGLCAIATLPGILGLRALRRRHG